MSGSRRRRITCGFFGVPIAAGCWCELDTSSFGAGVALAVSQATLAAPLLTGPATVQLFCNEVLVCTLSPDVPNVRLLLNVKASASFECSGPEGSAVHVGGYTYQVKSSPKRLDEETETDWEELQRGRKRRIEELQRDALAARPLPPSTRIPRLTFNPEVLVAEYIPKRSGISPGWARVSLDAMVAAREEFKARQALESMGGDDGDDDDGEMLQHMLAELLSCSLKKLRVICKVNGLVIGVDNNNSNKEAEKSALIERLVDHYAMVMRAERESGTRPS